MTTVKKFRCVIYKTRKASRWKRNEPRSLVRGLEILGEIKKVELRKKRETETSAEKTAEVK